MGQDPYESQLKKNETNRNPMTATNRDKMTAAESGMGSPKSVEKSMEMHKNVLNSATTRRTDKYNQTMRSQAGMNDTNLMMNIDEMSPGGKRK